MSLASIQGHAAFAKRRRRCPQPTVLSRRSTASDAVPQQTFAPYVAAGKARTPSTRPVPPRSPPPLVCNGASVSVFIAQNGFRGPRKLYTSGRAQRAERHHHGRNIVTR